MTMSDELSFSFNDIKPVEKEYNQGEEHNQGIEIEMSNSISFPTPKEKPNIIKVIGVGGGGSNAVTHMFNEGIKDVDFVLCNTDYQALAQSPVSTKVHLGERDLGAGNVPAVGREAAEKSTDVLRELLSKDTKMVFVTAGMGGGTGTGAAPVVAQIAQELGILTIGIVTLPFKVEGRRRMQQAREGIDNLRKHVDALLIISNDKLREEYGNMKLTEAFKKADDVLKTAAKGIAEIITVTGYVNVDFEDVNNVMRNSGKAIMGSARAEGEDRAQKAIEEAMNSPLLNDSDIKGAEKILIYITSGNDEVSLDEVMQINDFVQTECGNTAEIIWGNGTDSTLGNALGVTLIATGFKKDEMATDDITIYYSPSDQPQAENTIKDPLNEVNIENKPTPELEIVNNNEVEEQKAPVAEPAKVEETEKKDEDEIVYNLDGEQVKNDNNDYKPLSDEPQPHNEINDDITMPLYDENPIQQPHQHTSNTNPTNNESGPNVHRFSDPFHKHDKSSDDIFTNKANIQPVMDGYQTEQMPQPTTIDVMEQPITSQQQNTTSEQLRRERLKSLSMLSSSARGLETLESQPAYMRKGLNFNTEPFDDGRSRYSSNHNGLNNNSFLHDNVD